MNRDDSIVAGPFYLGGHICVCGLATPLLQLFLYLAGGCRRTDLSLSLCRVSGFWRFLRLCTWRCDFLPVRDLHACDAWGWKTDVSGQHLHQALKRQLHNCHYIPPGSLQTASSCILHSVLNAINNSCTPLRPP